MRQRSVCGSARFAAGGGASHLLGRFDTLAAVESRPGIILVVDDDHDVLDAIRGVLEREGYVVLAATNGVEAQRALAGKEVDLVLLDLMMPRLNGWELLEQLPDDGPPVIVISAAPADVAPVGKVRAVLPKPCGRGVLLAAVARHVRRAGGDA